MWWVFDIYLVYNKVGNCSTAFLKQLLAPSFKYSQIRFSETFALQKSSLLFPRKRNAYVKLLLPMRDWLYDT